MLLAGDCDELIYNRELSTCCVQHGCAEERCQAAQRSTTGDRHRSCPHVPLPVTRSSCLFTCSADGNQTSPPVLPANLNAPVHSATSFPRLGHFRIRPSIIPSLRLMLDLIALSVLMAICQVDLGPFWILLELRVMEVFVTTGAIRRAKPCSV